MTDGGDVHPLDADVWKKIAEEANACAPFRHGASHLDDVSVDLRCGDVALRLAFAAGEIHVARAAGPATVSFSAPDWMPLVTGKTSLVEAANPYFGSMVIQGEPLRVAWLLPSMGALIRIAARVRAGLQATTGEGSR